MGHKHNVKSFAFAINWLAEEDANALDDSDRWDLMTFKSTRLVADLYGEDEDEIATLVIKRRKQLAANRRRVRIARYRRAQAARKKK